MIDIYDFNYHIPILDKDVKDLQDPVNSRYLSDAIEQEFGLSKKEWKKIILRAAEESEEIFPIGSNLMILDSEIVKSTDNIDFLEQNIISRREVTALIDFRDPKAHSMISNWSEAGGFGIKFHPYLQAIEQRDWGSIIKLCELAETLGLIINVDCSYGTLGLYDHSGPKLIAEILKRVRFAPVVGLHFGGALVLDMCALAHTSENLYLDLSLSLSYWKGSSVIQNLAFAINRVGSKRFLFGSDHPFINRETARKDFLEFSEEYNLSSADINNISFENVSRLKVKK